MSRQDLTRRKFLALSSTLIATSAVAAGCSTTATPTPASKAADPTKAPESQPAAVPTQAPAAKPADAPKPTEAAKAAAPAAAPSKYVEAPTLAEQVKAGKLPPIEQRISDEPLVQKVREETGQYGGTWRRAIRSVSDFHSYGRLVYETMLRWPENPKDQPLPGIAKKWEFADEGKTLTLYLRKGLKWSDGQPFTADDIIFWWEYIANDKELSPAPPQEWVIDGKPMTLEKVDDATIKLKFAGPNGLALRMLCFHGNQWPLNFERFGFFAPKHYLSQFHPKLNKSVTDYKQFNQMADDLNPERPSLTAWRITSWKAGDTKMVATRNPYYWKVDEKGQQLPYIDEVRLDLIESFETIAVKTINGEIDMDFRHTQLVKYPLYQENKDKGQYRVFRWITGSGASQVIYLNQTHTDPEIRKLFQTKEFRQALSLAVDRAKTNEVVNLGLGKVRQATVIDASPYYVPEAETAFAKTDKATANSMLDALGLKKGADGFRMLPSGKTLEMTIEGQFTQPGPDTDAMELLKSAWDSVGVKTALKPSERALFWDRACGNQTMASMWSMDRAIEPFVDPIYIIPYANRSWFAPAFGTYYETGGAKGEKPTGDYAKAMELFDQFKRTIDPEKQASIGKEIIKLNADNTWIIGLSGAADTIIIAKNNFRNVPEKAISDWIYMTPGNLDPHTFFFKK